MSREPLLDIDFEVSEAIENLEGIDKRLRLLVFDLYLKYFDCDNSSNQIVFDKAKCYFGVICDYVHSLDKEILRLKTLKDIENEYN